MVGSSQASGELLQLLFEGDAPDYTWEKGDWELDPCSLTVKKAAKEPGEPRSTKPEVREVNSSERVKAQDVDVVLERTDNVPEEKRAELKGKCHVRGCGKSVLDLRDFNQRYHICGDHIKAPRILRNGRVERFCQQCSRFHAVTEFEGVKRSCQKQLERHNARRRKRPDAGAAGAAPRDPKPAVAAAAAAWASASGTTSGVLGSGSTGVAAAAGGLSAAAAGGLSASTVLNGDLMVSFMQDLFSHPQIFRSIKRILTAPPVDQRIEAYRSAVLSAALRQVEGEATSADALAELRIGVKLRGGLPDALPENLRQTVVLWLQAAQPQLCGCMRSGCVFVTLSIVLRHTERERAVARGAKSLLQAIRASDSRWGVNHLTVQIGDSIAYAQPHKEPAQIGASEAAFAGQLPRLTWVSAPVLVTDRETSIRLLVRGQHLHHIADEQRGSGPHGQATPTTLIARCGHDDSLMRSTAWLGGDTAEILICAPELSADGCALVWLEAWSGAYLSPAIPIFVTSNTDLACRVENLSYSLMDGLRERVPFGTTGWRNTINMYLRLCAQPPGMPPATGLQPGQAAREAWDQGDEAQAGQQRPQATQRYPSQAGWSGRDAYGFDAMHEARGRGRGEERNGGDGCVLPYGDGYHVITQIPPQHAQQGWSGPAQHAQHAQQGWSQAVQPEQQVQQGWSAPPQLAALAQQALPPDAQEVWIQLPQAPQQQMIPAATAAAVAAAAAAGAATASGTDMPPSKRQALQDAWDSYHGEAVGREDGTSVHGTSAHGSISPLPPQGAGGARVVDAESRNPTDSTYQHVHLSAGAAPHTHPMYGQTPFESGDLPSELTQRASTEGGQQRISSMDVPPSTDFSELFESMFKE